MEFRTKIDIPKSDLQISHKDNILMFGSCFIENIGNLLIKNKFDTNLNPFGILYNPQSISQVLELLIDKKKLSDENIFEYRGLYHSFYHHGSFSKNDKSECLKEINRGLEKAEERLEKANRLFITFGTAYVFRSKDQNMVVGNCHKLPASHFDRYRLCVEDIVNNWKVLIEKIREVNPSIQIIFTVSPIRHLKDGAYENQLSKSTLLLAIDKLRQTDASLHYFPSYEIVLDELRDYRFYNEDMTHPNSVAIKYIWERFCETYFDKETLSITEEWQKIHLAINHRPLNENGEEYKLFLRQTLLKLKAFNEKYTYICCSDEIDSLEIRL